MFLKARLQGHFLSAVPQRESARTGALALALIVAVHLPHPLSAADTNSVTTPLATESYAQEAQEISDRVMSPYCPGRTLSACPSEPARQLRGEIRGWLAEGYTETAVENRLKMMYGQEVMGRPPARGFGLLGWLMPALFVFLLLISILLLLRRLRQVERRVDFAPEEIAAAERELSNLEIESDQRSRNDA